MKEVLTPSSKELEDIIDTMQCCGNCKHLIDDYKCLFHKSFIKKPNFVCDDWRFDWSHYNIFLTYASTAHNLLCLYYRH